MTTGTSKKVGAARQKAAPSVAAVPDPEPLAKTVNIVGFAPSWIDTPWDDDAELWGMNALHKLAPDKKWDAWFQLHDIERHHPNDRDEHVEWLAQCGIPVFMWAEHADKYRSIIPTAVPYPKERVLSHFDRYFTNTVSWMIALGIMMEFQDIGVYGIDMAQDSEYAHQRPSCEFFLGWARGKGINLHIPATSDLLKTAFLYGAEDAEPFRIKLESRLEDLLARRKETQDEFAKLNQQAQMQHQIMLQLDGAIEDTRYWIRAWSTPLNNGDKNEQERVIQVA